MPPLVNKNIEALNLENAHPRLEALSSGYSNIEPMWKAMVINRGGRPGVIYLRIQAPLGNAKIAIVSPKIGRPWAFISFS
jgi:hypothetical protein